MANSRDLAKAMKAALDEKGDLINLRTRLEEDVLEASGQLQYQSEHKGIAHTSMTKRCKPAMSPEIILANNLIRQYLDHVGLQNTSTVLSSECGMSEAPHSDSALKAALPSGQGLNERPHIWNMVRKFLN